MASFSLPRFQRATIDAEGVLRELQVLLGGLWTAATKPASVVAALPASAPSLERDAAVFVIFAVYFFIINWGVRLLLIEPWLRRHLRLKPGMRTKVAQSCMEILFYGGFTIIGLVVVLQQEWSWPSAKWWIGVVDGGHEIMRADLRCYYIMYAARYLQGGISVLLEPRRKDFVEMQVHHWVTVALSTISYAYGLNRVGAVVMLILDPADVPLHAAKLCKYLHDALLKTIYQQMADIMFVFFAVVFLVTRLGFYPYVCWSVVVEAETYYQKGRPEWCCLVLLLVVLGLQIYWFSLILRVAWKVIVTKQGAEDVRSDDEEDLNNGEAVKDSNVKQKQPEFARGRGRKED